jgi:hypothetical protein
MASGSAFERAWEAFQQARYPGGVPPELSARRLTREFFRWGQRLAAADPALSALWQEAIQEAALPFLDSEGQRLGNGADSGTVAGFEVKPDGTRERVLARRPRRKGK